MTDSPTKISYLDYPSAGLFRRLASMVYDALIVFALWFLIALAAAFFGLIGVLTNWGGRIEATLMVYGKPVLVVVDAGRPRIVLLFSLPVLLAAGAIATRKQRKLE